MALGSTQPLVKVSIRTIPGGKGGRYVRLTTPPFSRAECHEIWELKTAGTIWVTLGLLQDCFTYFTPSRFRGSLLQLITLRHSHTHTRLDSSGRGIGLSHRHLPDNTQHSQERYNNDPRLDSNPQTIGRRTTPYTGRPPPPHAISC